VRTRCPPFRKVQIAIAALRADAILPEIDERHRVRAGDVPRWKRRLTHDTAL